MCRVRNRNMLFPSQSHIIKKRKRCWQQSNLFIYNVNICTDHTSDMKKKGVILMKGIKRNIEQKRERIMPGKGETVVKRKKQLCILVLGSELEIPMN